MELKKNVIIDCDPGIDDALALMLALKSSEINVIGITIVAGNVPVNQGAKNALKVLKLMNRLDIPVYIGNDIPLKRELVTAQDTHGDDGLGETFFKDVNLDENKDVKINQNAEDFIIENAKLENVSLIALGPMTNLARAIKKDKKSFNKLVEIVSMGGNYKSNGNCSQVAEFNYWVDPDAANFVFKNIEMPFSMVGLDVTREIVLTPNYREFISQIGGEIAEFVVEITQFYVDFHWKQERTLGCVINDPLAVAYFIDKTMCSGFLSNVEVVEDGPAMGQTLVDVADFYKRRKNAKVMTEVDSPKFMKFFLNRLFENNEEDIDLVINLQNK